MDLGSEFECLKEKLERIEKGMADLMRRFDSTHVEAKCQKEIYRAADLANVMNMSVSTVRKNYLNKDKIRGVMRNGEWEIPASEFERVSDVMTRLGRSYL